jgi:hypothetical protein
LAVLVLSGLVSAEETPCSPVPPTANVEVNFKKSTSKVKDLAAWYRKVTCREIEAPLSAADAPLGLTLEGKISAPSVLHVVRAAAASAGYNVSEGIKKLTLQKAVEPCNPAKARAALEKLSTSNCVLDLDVFGDGECLDLHVTLQPEEEKLKVSKLAAGSLLHALGLREGDVLADDKSAVMARGAVPLFELQLTRGQAQKTLRCDIKGDLLRLHPANLLREALLPTGSLVSADECSVDPSAFTTKGDVVEVKTSKASGLEFACMMKACRIVPAFHDGKSEGLKLYAIRPNSVPSLLGLQNGDLLKAINGRPIDKPDAALEAYSALRKEKKFEVALVRRGEPKTLQIILK